MQNLSQQQRLLLKLSPQQIQLMKLLQVPTAQLEERVKEEIEENPALEMDAEDETDADIYNEDQSADDTDDDYITEDSAVDDLESIKLEDYIKEGDDAEADYNFKNDPYNPDNEDTGDRNTPRLETSFYDVLVNQLGMTDLDEQELQIAEHIIGSIEEDGYLRREINSIVDDLSFRNNIQTTVDVVKKIIAIIQDFEPAGVAAKDLQECLLLQLERSNSPTIHHPLAIKIIKKYFEEFSKKHYPKIQRSLQITDDELRDVIHIITKLNPRPGAGYESGHKVDTYLVPDFFVQNINGQLQLTLNGRNAPELRISSNYRDMLRDYEKTQHKDPRQKEAVLFLKQKLDSAKWFIDAIKQRQHTMYLSMETIIKYQEAFFISGSEMDLKPMILKDIANRTGLDISTISRVANSKYVQTEFGTFKLKYFFSESLSTDSGEEVSTREVKKILEEAIEAENKQNPISDELLSIVLKEKGYNIARRTVAKYREQLNIPVARLRKEL
jgi:RNA polymerase sigma-54 factor